MGGPHKSTLWRLLWVTVTASSPLEVRTLPDADSEDLVELTQRLPTELLDLDVDAVGR
jgi:hypothetical protein